MKPSHAPRMIITGIDNKGKHSSVDAQRCQQRVKDISPLQPTRKADTIIDVNWMRYKGPR